MVYFVCDKCQTTLKKNQVDKHYGHCRNPSVSCVDCGVSFPDEEYNGHTTCISEAEKYQGALYKGKRKDDKANANGDGKKQKVEQKEEKPAEKKDHKIATPATPVTPVAEQKDADSGDEEGQHKPEKVLRKKFKKLIPSILKKAQDGQMSISDLRTKYIAEAKEQLKGKLDEKAIEEHYNKAILGSDLIVVKLSS
eukprot:TRINITY_DN8268_c0_g1_i1.p2 TRINITY_DN8268_c0_g1~~TRINITY_DN8268_c0_g1_i1.p2  ORF type:complete len:195 (-),score=56.94 TRINITY_DN8268_c0_g1_i1:158-742(-)